MPLAVALPTGYSGHPVSSPRNTSNCFPRGWTNLRDIQQVLVVSHIFLLWQYFISTEIFWRWYTKSYISSREIFIGVQSWCGRNIGGQDGAWLLSEHIVGHLFTTLGCCLRPAIYSSGAGPGQWQKWVLGMHTGVCMENTCGPGKGARGTIRAWHSATIRRSTAVTH